MGSNPGWYTDEATHIDITQHLMRGEIRYMLVTESTMLFARLPLFHLVLLPLFTVTGASDRLLILRLVVVSFSLVSIVLVYLLARRQHPWLGLLSAAALALFPQAVLFNRLGFSYNLLAPLVLLAIIGLDRYTDGANGRWLALSALAMGLGLVTDILAIGFVPAYLLFALRRPRGLLWALPLMLLPVTIYALWMLSQSAEAWMFDVRYTFLRGTSGETLIGQWNNIATNLKLLFESPWWVLGIAGAFLLPRRLGWHVPFFIFFPIFSVGRSNGLVNLGAYYAIPLLPLLALGIAALIYRSVMWVSRRFGRKPSNSLMRRAMLALIGIAVVLGAGLSLFDTARSVTQSFATYFDPLLMPEADVRAVADYLNTEADSADVIVTTPVVGWLLHANAIDYQIAVAAAESIETRYLPSDIDPSRFAFNPNYRAAAFVVIDDSWRAWGIDNVPTLAELMQVVESDWQVVFQSGNYAVYRNPAR